MSEFKVPVHLEDLEAAGDDDRYRVLHVSNILGRDEAAQHEKLDGLQSALFDAAVPASESIAESETFDGLYSYAKVFADLAPSVRVRLTETLCRVVERLLGELPGQQNAEALRRAFTMAVYLLYATLCAGEKMRAEELSTSLQQKGRRKRPAGAFDWDRFRLDCLRTLTRVARADFRALWRMGVADDDYLMLLPRAAMESMQSAEAMRVKAVRQQSLDLFSAALSSSKTLTTPAAAGALSVLGAGEHTAGVLAEACALCCEAEGFGSDGFDEGALKASDFPLALEMLREVSAAPMGAEALKNNGQGVRAQSQFVSSLAERRPSVVLAAMATLLRHLDSEAHPIRMAIVHSIAHICGSCFGDNLSLRNDAGEAQGEAARTRETLLDVLSERSRDTNAFVRAQVMKAWALLAERRALPVQRLRGCAELAAERLRDRSSLVRKAASQLLAALLEHNPFMGNLTPDFHARRVHDIEAWMQDHPPPAPREAPALVPEAEEDAGGAEGSDEASGISGNSEHSEHSENSEGSENSPNSENSPSSPSSPKSEGVEDSEDADAGEDLAAGPEEDDPFFEERLAQQRQLSFFRSAHSFALLLEASSGTLLGMLRSTTPSDVVESLRFFRSARYFKLPCAGKGLRAALKLLWHSEESVRCAAVDAFTAVYVCDCEGAPLPDDRIAKNLCVLANQTTQSETASLQRLVEKLAFNSKLSDGVWNALWGVLAAERPSAQWRRVRCAAMQLIAMGSRSDPTVLKRGLRVLAHRVLTPAAREDRRWTILRHAADALKALPSQLEAATGAEPLPKALAEELCERLAALLLSDAVDEQRRAAGQAPAANAGAAEGATGETAGATGETAGEGIEGSPTEVPSADWQMEDLEGDWAQAGEDAVGRRWFPLCEAAVEALCRLHPTPEALLGAIIKRLACRLFRGPGSQPPVRLSRFFFLLSHSAVCLLELAEAVGSAVKKRRGALSSAKDGAKKGDEEDEEEDGMTLNANMAADLERDQLLQAIAEKELVCRNLLGAFGPLLVSVVGNKEGRFSASRYALLREVSCLSLCKFAAVSSEFCEVALPLVFTELEASEDAAVRATFVVALGDLCVRFPNELEPWTPNLYARLRDPSRRVRRHTLAVLTQLVLNDMVKVKGNVSEVAMCLEDTDPRLRDAAKMFFREVAKRGNSPIYNLLPDVISRLSAAAAIYVKAEGLADAPAAVSPELAPASGEPQGPAHAEDTEDTGDAGDGEGSPAEGSPAQPAAAEDTAADPSEGSAADPSEGSSADPSEAASDESGQTVASDNAERLRRDDGAFRRILGFLLTFIKKDKQAEQLIEKLALRLVHAPHARGARDLSFCIAQLSVNERSLKKLAELLPRYRAQLSDAEVHAHLTAVNAKARRIAKPEVREACEAWQLQLDTAHAGGSEDDAAAAAAAKASKKAARRANRARAAPADENVEPSNLRRSGRARAEKAAIVEDDGSDEEFVEA